MRLKCSLVLTALIGALLTSVATTKAGSVNLWGIADGDSVYQEQSSDAFFRMDLYDPPPRQTQQRFHAISNPSVQFGSLAFDGFPNDANFRLGSVTFDDSGIVGGTGIAPITALSLGVGADPANAAYVNYARWSPIVTTVDSIGLGSTVTLTGGVVTSINLTSNVHLNIPALANVAAPGTFSITGNRFDGHMETLSTGPNSQIIWDFGGTLTTVVPEPATWLLAMTGMLGVATVSLRRLRHVR